MRRLKCWGTKTAHRIKYAGEQGTGGAHEQSKVEKKEHYTLTSLLTSAEWEKSSIELQFKCHLPITI